MFAGVWLTLLALAGALALSLVAPSLARGVRPAQPLRWAPVPLAAVFWALAGLALGAARAARGIHDDRVLRSLHRASLSLVHAHISPPSATLTDVLVVAALISSLLAVRALRRPGRLGQPFSQDALQRAHAIVEEHGDDSLAPFILRPDKCFQFAAGAVAAYTVVGETAIVSADPVGPPSACAAAVAELLRGARGAGLNLVLYGASERHLDSYRALGLKTLCVGEEAIVDPTGFSLEGRPVRKLRQSVHRLERRGWRTAVREGRDVDAALEHEIDELEAEWRVERRHVLGFTMGMGEFDFGVRPDDVFVLAWAPDGRLRAVMRFLAHAGKLSLDTMHKTGVTPNGLNEALVCKLLEFARRREVAEVSLNYAGLGHLFRLGPQGNRLVRTLLRLLLRPLRRRFQMDRLVLFNRKFSPCWRPRYLVYDSRAALPRSVLRVLQVEGYLPGGAIRWDEREAERWMRHPGSVTR